MNYEARNKVAKKVKYALQDHQDMHNQQDSFLLVCLLHRQHKPAAETAMTS